MRRFSVFRYSWFNCDNQKHNAAYPGLHGRVRGAGRVRGDPEHGPRGDGHAAEVHLRQALSPCPGPGRGRGREEERKRAEETRKSIL